MAKHNTIIRYIYKSKIKEYILEKTPNDAIRNKSKLINYLKEVAETYFFKRYRYLPIEGQDYVIAIKIGLDKLPVSSYLSQYERGKQLIPLYVVFVGNDEETISIES